MSRVVLIAGPTASGKSGRALALARAENGVVINADSLQVYRDLPLLTAQPSPAEQDNIPHRLYGFMSHDQQSAAPKWRDLALAEIEAVLAVGKLPIIVGGTGLYFKTLTQGMSPIPDVPAEIREATMALQRDVGHPKFHELLTARDPVMGAKLHPNDTQRLIRAWEVLEATGKSLSFWQALPPERPGPSYEFETILIMPERDELYDRCNARFDIMMEQGVLDEAAAFDVRIRAGEVAEDAAVTHALGFRPLQALLRGELPQAEAIEKAKAETRQYAKRQVTWFRHQPIS